MERPRHRVPLWLRLLLTLTVLAVVIWRVVLPQLADGQRALASLKNVSLWLVLAALLLELGSLAAYSALTAAVLGSPRPAYFTLLRIDLTGLGVSHVVPGGGATAAALRFELLFHARTPPEDALSAAAIETTGSNLVLGGMFGVGLAVSLTMFADNYYYRAVAIALLVFLVLSGVVCWLVVDHIERSIVVVRAVARRLRFVNESAAGSFVQALADRLRELASHPRRMVTALVLASANWLLDASALWIVMAAFGEHVHLGALLTVYGVGNLLPLIPLTPGGLGLVEGVMVSAFAGFGVSPAAAVLGVVGWRLLQFWMPIPLAGAAYLSLRLGALSHALRRKSFSH